MELYLIYIGLAALLLVGVRFAKKGEYFEDYMSLGTAKAAQGFCAAAIIVHHATQELTNCGAIPSVLGPFNEVGPYLVGFFFFYSGYGLITSLAKKEQYLDGFLKKRLPSLLIPFFLSNIIYIVYIQCVYGYSGFTGLMYYILGLRLPNGHTWYIIAQLLLYLVFYFVFRSDRRERTKYALMLLYIAAYITLCLYCGHGDGSSWFQGEWWFNSILCFFCGMLWARFQPQILAALKKRYWLYLAIAAAAAVLLCRASLWMLQNVSYWAEWPGHPGFAEKWQCFAVQAPSVIAVVLLFMIINLKLRFYNRALAFLGSLTLEIYVIHRAFLIAFGFLKFSDLLYIAAVAAAGVFAAWLLHLVSGVVRRGIDRVLYR